ncbi:MAG: tRNA-dihydrouridine synthase family protein, partial [Cyanobacteria bacterium J06641_2]
ENPRIFNQIRQILQSKPISLVPLIEVREYIDRLRQTPEAVKTPPRARAGHLKMYLNYIALLVDTNGNFLRTMRKTKTELELLKLCDSVLLNDKNLALAPYSSRELGVRS